VRQVRLPLPQLDAARQLTGAKVLAERLYGVGPATALAITRWLGGGGRFSSSRKEPGDDAHRGLRFLASRQH